MEFAISAVLLIALLLPGFILHNAYTRGLWRWNSPASPQSIVEQIPSAVVSASILHMVWATGSIWLGNHVDLGATLMLLLGSYGHNETHFDATITEFTHHPYQVFWYFLSLYIFSFLLGYSSHYVVRKLKWDLKFRFLRFNNEWYYLLSGEIMKFGEFDSNEGKVDGVYLTTVVHHSKEDYLYRGIVVDFFFDKAGNLDRILLSDVLRRCLSNDRNSDEPYSNAPDKRYYDIKGNYFLLRYSEISTINLDYLFLSEESEDESPRDT